MLDQSTGCVRKVPLTLDLLPSCSLCMQGTCLVCGVADSCPPRECGLGSLVVYGRQKSLIFSGYFIFIFLYLEWILY